MKYAFLVLSLAFVTGCGAFTNKDVASDVIVDDGRTVEQVGGNTDDQFALDNIISGNGGDKVIVGDTEVIIIEEDKKALPGTTTQDATVTVDQGTSAPVTGRTSPVTGPSIPEAEMRAILNAQLVANGEEPRY